MTIYDDKTLTRFWQKVDKRGPDECWEWEAGRNPDGYGRFRLSASHGIVQAHRVSYEIEHGPIGVLKVCHTCDNPPCCNPNHLWLGTQKNNVQDMDRKGRRGKSNVFGSRVKSAQLSEQQVIEIRNLFSYGARNRDIMWLYPVSSTLVSKIRRGKTWKHLV